MNSSNAGAEGEEESKGVQSGKATGEGELAQAIISCKGQCEGWLYKTS